MHPIPFKGQTRVYAANQPPYRPMPAHRADLGVVTCCWRLSWHERLYVLLTGRIWQKVLTFNKPLQPQLLSTVKPKLEESIDGR
jgi:hypothetical protein